MLLFRIDTSCQSQVRNWSEISVLPSSHLDSVHQPMQVWPPAGQPAKDLHWPPSVLSLCKNNQQMVRNVRALKSEKCAYLYEYSFAVSMENTQNAIFFRMVNRKIRIFSTAFVPQSVSFFLRHTEQQSTHKNLTWRRWMSCSWEDFGDKLAHFKGPHSPHWKVFKELRCRFNLSAWNLHWFFLWGAINFSREPGVKEDLYSILWPLKVTTHVFFFKIYLKKEAGFVSGLPWVSSFSVCK